MSKLICVMGESGSGKTTAMRTLDPKTTYYVDCDGKGLAWKGWRKQYHSEAKNYTVSRDIPKITKLIVDISEKKTETKTIVVDTLNTCMVDKEIKGMKENGYGKWIDLTQFVWDCIETAGKQRADLTIIFIMHSETVRDDFGYSFTRVKPTDGSWKSWFLKACLERFFWQRRTRRTAMYLRPNLKTARQKAQWEPLNPLRSTTIWQWS